MNWQPIETHNGDLYVPCLVCACGVVGEASLKEGHRDRIGWWWANTDPMDHWADEISEPPTHWMPLPDPPHD